MKKYFGTDGIRGVYKEFLTEELCYKVGSSLGAYFSGTALVAFDTRPSSESLCDAIVRGLNSSGVKVKIASILPTPAVSVLTKKLSYNFGIMISASHNEPKYNGIKVFNADGSKLNLSQEKEIEMLINNPVLKTKSSSFSRLFEAEDIYIEHLIKEKHDLRGLNVLLDCANGAVGDIPKKVFEYFNARVKSINDTYEGSLINVSCGSLHIEKYKDLDYDFVFAYDGDGDRMASIHRKELVDGDSVLYSMSKKMELRDNVVVSTIMSNSALEDALSKDAKKLIKTQVGDKNICDIMIKNGYNLGGESSGHYIFYPFCLTGDGIKASLNVASADIHRLDLFPQKTISLYAKREILSNEKLIKLIKEYEGRLKRLVVRMSGTEPKLRIMAEDKNKNLIDEALSDFTALIGEELKK